MHIKLRRADQDGMMQTESAGAVKEILINEDFLHPEKESISVCFKGKSSSGIIDFTPSELNRVMDAIRGRMHLIRGMKKLQ